MRKNTFLRFLLASLCTLVLLQSCKDDSYLLTPPPVPDQSFEEEFDTAQSAYDRGWRWINRSDVIGRRNWQNPTTIPFAPYSGVTGNGYIYADYLSTASGAGVISNWAVSPSLIMQNGDKIVFYTRSQLDGNTDWVNRMQVRMNKYNTLNCGNGVTYGDFTIPLLDINPFYYEFLLNVFNNPASPQYAQVRQAYPHVWTRYEATVHGLNEPTRGRFAFRYFVEGAGNNGRANAIAVDNVVYVGKH